MSWSVTEIAALAAKAARGAGAPPLQAARFGQAAARHLAAGRDGGVLKAALAALPAGPVLQVPIALDAALACGQADAPLHPGDVAPDFLCSYVECLPFQAALAQERDRLLLRVDLSHPAPQQRPARIICDADFIAELEHLAARTYVPDTAQSRARGAGAGLTDND